MPIDLFAYASRRDAAMLDYAARRCADDLQRQMAALRCFADDDAPRAAAALMLTPSAPLRC